MDGFFESGEQSCSVETGWDQIEKRLMNSAVMHSTSHEAVQICKNLTENKEYITTSQYNAMVGIKSEHTCLDPNIVMDLRHSKDGKKERRCKSTTSITWPRYKVIANDRLHFQKMFELNREIHKYKKSLENIRPRTSEFKSIGIVKPNCTSIRYIKPINKISHQTVGDDVQIPSHDLMLTQCEVDEMLIRCEVTEVEDECHHYGREEECEQQDPMIEMAEECEQEEQVSEVEEECEQQDPVFKMEEKYEQQDPVIKMEERREQQDPFSDLEEKWDQEQQDQVFEGGDDNEPFNAVSPPPIPSECLKDESFVTDSTDIIGFIEDTRVREQSVSPCTSTRTEVKTVVSQEPYIQQLNEDFECIINPTIMVNIQEAIRSNLSHELHQIQSELENRPTDYHRESMIAVNQHMSIKIKRLSNEKIVVEKSTADCNETTECNQEPNKKSHTNFLLQKYFLQWVHFNTIKKLQRRNPTQTRVQQIEAFLQNITHERKNALKKLRRKKNPSRGDDDNRTAGNGTNVTTAQVNARAYNKKLKTQQDIIELQKIKLQRQQRVITELKLTKLLDDRNEAENQLTEEISLVAKNGCANSRSKAKCLRITGNLKNKTIKQKSELQAKGTAVPKFLIEMQARSLEREMKHQEAQRRRENLDREREAMRLAAEEEKRLLDEQTKRERIKLYWRKRREEKEIEAQKAADRMKYLANLELCRAFYRARLLKEAMEKFKNILKWKRRNKKVCIEFRRRIISKAYFQKWRKITLQVWEERKSKADACYDKHCMKIAWELWQKIYVVTQNKQFLAEDWFHLKISVRVFRAWKGIAAQTRLVYETKEKLAETHFSWYTKWKVLERWRRLHAILKIERDTEARRERWRNKVYDLIPDYTPNTELI